jgi:hypothetical protein
MWLGRTKEAFDNLVEAVQTQKPVNAEMTTGSLKRWYVKELQLGSSEKEQLVYFEHQGYAAFGVPLGHIKEVELLSAMGERRVR